MQKRSQKATMSLSKTNSLSLSKNSQQDYIRNNPIQLYIPNAVAYKGDSHSTKVRICWDATRKTGPGTPLNTQLMRGTSSYSMTKSLLFFRRGRFALSCDISKFYNRLVLHPEHFNLHLSLWRPNMDPESEAQIFTAWPALLPSC